MTIWALADLHLPFAAPDKSMEVFGEGWSDYTQRIEQHWNDLVIADDLVLLPGDISWAMRLENALIDLEWIDKLPGTKLMIRGNHDYWWQSKKKLRSAMPPSLHILHNDTFSWNGVAIGGTRMWDTPEFSFGNGGSIDTNEEKKESDAKIFARELQRLELSLQQLDKEASKRIAMVHYPPVGADLAPSRASALLEQYRVDICVFGHLHNFSPGSLPFGKARGVEYFLTAADYLEFTPLKIME